MTSQLKAWLKSKGLKVSGGKQELVRRVALSGEAPAAGAAAPKVVPGAKKKAAAAAAADLAGVDKMDAMLLHHTVRNHPLALRRGFGIPRMMQG